MADYLDISKIVSEGYSAGKAVSEDIASKDILQQAYAGQTPEEIKDPIKQAATLNQAAGMLNSKGLSSAAFAQQQAATAAQNRMLQGTGTLTSGLSTLGGLFNGTSNQTSSQNIAGYASSGAGYQQSFGSDTQFGSYDSGAYQGPV